jgi:hypothetical protein
MSEDGATNGGHTYLDLACGAAEGAHWENQLDDRKEPVFEKRSFEDFTKAAWPSGIVAVSLGTRQWTEAG